MKGGSSFTQQPLRAVPPFKGHRSQCTLKVNSFQNCAIGHWKQLLKPQCYFPMMLKNFRCGELQAGGSPSKTWCFYLLQRIHFPLTNLLETCAEVPSPPQMLQSSLCMSYKRQSDARNLAGAEIKGKISAGGVRWQLLHSSVYPVTEQHVSPKWIKKL